MLISGFQQAPMPYKSNEKNNMDLLDFNDY